MSNAFRSQTSEVMCLAWQMVKRNGYSMSEALKTAWMNIKLKAAMKERIVRFYFQKVDGSLREAYGTHEPGSKIVIVRVEKINKKDSYERCLFRRRYFYYGV